MAGVLEINRDFVKWKALYFLMTASLGPYVYFLVNFYLTRGLTYEQAGFIESIVPFLGCIFRPLACYLADRFALHRSLLASSIAVYALSLFGFLVLSTRYDLIVPIGNTGQSLSNGTTYAFLNTTLNNVTSASTAGTTATFVFPVMCGLRFLSTVGMTPATSLLDGIVYHSLESAGQSANWGRQRLWGSIGFSSAALFSAFLLDMFDVINFVIGFSMAFALAVLLFVVSLTTVTSYKTTQDTENTEKNLMSPKDNEPPRPVVKNHFLYVIGFIFRDGHILLVLAVAAAVGYFTAFRDIYTSQFIESITQTSSKKVMGVMQGILGSLEIPVMFTAGWFFKKIGTMPFFAASFAAFSIRFFFYTLLTAETIWLFLVIEVLHLFSFGFVVPAFTLHAHRRTAKRQNALIDMSTIMQGLVSSLYLGFGYGIGSVIGGILMQKFSETKGIECMLIFSATAAGCFIVFCIVWLGMFLFSRRGRKNADNSYELPQTTQNQQNDATIVEQ